MQAMEADPVRDMAHPEGIGVEIRHKSCRGMQLMLYVNLAKQTGRAACRVGIILAFIALWHIL